MSRPVFGALLLIGAFAWPTHVGAQVAEPDTVLGDTLLASREVTAEAQDSVVVFLRRRGQYRLLVSRPLQLAAATPVRRARAAFVADVTPNLSAPYTILEIHPYTNGEHLITIPGIAAEDTVRFWLWADRSEELRAQARRDRLWGIGLQVGGGFHTGYLVEPTDPAPADPSADFEAGLLIGSSGIFSGLLGMTYHPRYSGAKHLVWVFAEPRVRVYDRSTGRLPVDIDVAVRAGRGTAGLTAGTPTLVGGGVVASRSLGTRPGARGWRISLSVMYGRLGNISDPSDRSFFRGGLALSWLP